MISKMRRDTINKNALNDIEDYRISEMNNRSSNLSKKEIIRDLLYKSLIGKDIEVVESVNKTYVGIKGKIVNETENLFFIKTKDRIKKLLKKSIVFKIDYVMMKKDIKYSKTLKINGELLNTNLISRIKKIKKF